jgi:hypothetical protein
VSPSVPPSVPPVSSALPVLPVLALELVSLELVPPSPVVEPASSQPP